MDRQIEPLGMHDGLSAPRPLRRRSQTVLILLGCGILQLPIWGSHMEVHVSLRESADHV